MNAASFCSSAQNLIFFIHSQSLFVHDCFCVIEPKYRFMSNLCAWFLKAVILLLLTISLLLHLRHLLLFHFDLLALVRHNLLCLLCSLLNLRVCLLYLLAISSVFITTVATQMGIKILLQKVFSTFWTVDALSLNLFSHFFFSHFCSATVTLKHLLLFHFDLLALVRHNLCLLCSLFRACLLYLRLCYLLRCCLL